MTCRRLQETWRPRLQPFFCPECEHASMFDPRVESARCPRCGHTPPRSLRLDALRPTRSPGQHHPFLDKLLSHWSGAHTPDTSLALPTPELALGFFEHYRWAVGQDIHAPGGGQALQVPTYDPTRGDILSFVCAYALLERGDRSAAAQYLRDLTSARPHFVEPWIWLSASTDVPEERVRCLEVALLNEPAHPLARDAMAIARGRVSPPDARSTEAVGPAAIAAVCPLCGGSLHYEPGATTVVCPFCGHQLDLCKADLIQGDATLVSDLSLRRRYRSHAWTDMQRTARCPSCGAALSLTDHLNDQCAFCGTTTVLVEQGGTAFPQPDGFLPFEVDETEAAAAMRQALRLSLHRLRAWLTRREHALQGLQGVYLPFWVFDGFVEARVRRFGLPERSILRTGPSQSRDVLMFTDLLFPAVEVPAPSMLSRLMPYELHELVPYEPHRLADWRAALPQRDVEAVVEDARAAMLDRSRARLGTLPAPRRGEHRRPQRSLQVTSTTYQLVLLPVWIGKMEGGNKPSLVLVNGQTGKVVLEHSWLCDSRADDPKQPWWDRPGQQAEAVPTAGVDGRQDHQRRASPQPSTAAPLGGKRF